MSEYEKKPISVITVTGGMLGAIISMFVGSFFGAAGTLYGAALGSGISAIGGTVYENAARKAHATLRARKEQEKDETQLPRHHLQEQLIELPLGREALIRSRQKRILMQERNPWRTAAISLGMITGCFVAAVTTLLVVETATGKTLHASLTGNAQYGNSFSYSTKSPSPAVSPSSVPSTAVSPDSSPVVIPSGGVPSSGLTLIPTSSPSAASPPSGATAPAGNAEPSSLIPTAGKSGTATTAFPAG